VEPHLSVTAACSAEWVPIRPKTDPAFLYALIHVMLFEHPRARLDVPFLQESTSSPYLVGPNGFFLRDSVSRKPIIAKSLEEKVNVRSIEIGPDNEVLAEGELEGETAFSKLLAHMKPYTPEWAAKICDVPAATIRRIAGEYLDHAHIGETIVIDGKTLPFRPVAVALGKTVNNGWGGFECCWARTMLAALVGALEVPGGTLGTTVRLNKPLSERHASVQPGADGFMAYPLNPTSKEHWKVEPNIRNAYRTLVPLAANGPWSQALGPTHFSWMFLGETPPGLPRVTYPELWFVYRTNPAISFWDTGQVTDRMAQFPFIVALAYTRDETNHFADVLLPDQVDLESLQLIYVGGSKYIEQFWKHEGYALRQPAVKPAVDARDFTDIATELAARAGLLERYNASINRGAAGVALKGEGWDFSLATDRKHSRDEIWDAVCRAASAELTDGRETHGLDWWKEHGLRVKPFPQSDWYLFPTLKAQGLRFELPYQEQLLRVGTELGRRLHEQGIQWWDRQLAEYQGLPAWKEFPKLWEEDTARLGGASGDYPFWLLTSRSMQYAWGGNVGMQMIHEVASNVAGHGGVILNAGKAAELGIAAGDLVEIATPVKKVRARAVPRQGIRPDTLLLIAQFDHWVTPYAKDFGVPSMNSLTPMSMPLTDATGSGADVVRVSVRKI
jgi:phenylacetyl-CoA:acceptor oxidoreductase